MLIAAALAIMIRVNLVLAVAAVWITNPITMPPIYYFCYQLGAWLLGQRAPNLPFEPSLQWFWQELNWIWQPFLLGSLVCGIVASLTGYVSVQLLWRLYVVQAMRSRRLRRGKDRG